jgi:hypothetical protein
MRLRRSFAIDPNAERRSPPVSHYGNYGKEIDSEIKVADARHDEPTRVVRLSTDSAALRT